MFSDHAPVYLEIIKLSMAKPKLHLNYSNHIKIYFFIFYKTEILRIWGLLAYQFISILAYQFKKEQAERNVNILLNQYVWNRMKLPTTQSKLINQN